jgi:hypothetical protein
MKKSLIVLTVVLFGSLFIIACNQKAELKTENEEVAEIEVFSVHDVTIKSGVDEKLFEAFVIKEIAPLYGQMKGQNLFLVKGERGIRKGQYAILLTFTSIEDLYRIYPQDIGFSEEFNKVFEGKDSLWVKFDSMAEGFDGKHNTDYVKVVY